MPSLTRPQAPGPVALPRCGGCGQAAEDVWPCPSCRQQLHPGCGYGLDYRDYRDCGGPRKLARLPGEVITGEWICRGCGVIAGLDTEPARHAAPAGAYCADGEVAEPRLATITVLPARRGTARPAASRSGSPA